jgi:hypothetical protein
MRPGACAGTGLTHMPDGYEGIERRGEMIRQERLAVIRRVISFAFA